MKLIKQETYMIGNDQVKYLDTIGNIKIFTCGGNGSLGLYFVNSNADVVKTMLFEPETERSLSYILDAKLD